MNHDTLNKMTQLNKMAFGPEICFIRKCVIIMTWLHIKIAILMHIYLKCSSKWDFGTKIHKYYKIKSIFFHNP